MNRLILATAIAACTSAAQAADFSLRLIGEHSIATGTLFDGVEFGGISGLDRAADGNFWAISDDRGGERGTPRFYDLSLDYDATGFHGVAINRQINMQRPDGSAFPASSRTVDRKASASRRTAIFTGRPRATGAPRLPAATNPSCAK